MAHDNSGARKPFRYMYNPERGGSFAKVDWLGFVQISGYFGSVYPDTWPVTPLKGDCAGKPSNVAEKDLQRISQDELSECFSLTGRSRPAGTGGPRPGQTNRSDRPQKPTLFLRNPPFGIRARIVLTEGNQVEIQLSHDDQSILTEVIPAIAYRNDSGNHPVRDENGRILRTWSHCNYELTWVNREGQEIHVGANGEVVSAEGGSAEVGLDDERES